MCVQFCNVLKSLDPMLLKLQVHMSTHNHSQLDYFLNTK